jgi:hypothetical protein
MLKHLPARALNEASLDQQLNEAHEASLQRNAQISHAPCLANWVRPVCGASVDHDRLLKLQVIPSPIPFLCFAMVTLALNIRLFSFVPPLTFANTLALIPFPKWIGPYMV